MAAKKGSGPLRREELDPEPPVKVGALRRPLGFPAADRNPQRDVRTGRLTQAPGRSMLVQKIVAPTRALQANSAFHFSKSGHPPWRSRDTACPEGNTRLARDSHNLKFAQTG